MTEKSEVAMMQQHGRIRRDGTFNPVPTVTPIIIGGAEVYEQAKHLVTTMFVTEVHHEVPEPFTFLELDTEGWERTVLLEGEEFDIVRYTKSGK